MAGISKRRVRLAAILIPVFLLGFAISCNKDDDGGGNGGGNPGQNEVWIQGNAFVPSSRTVSTGTTITWTNKDAAAHTVTGTGFDSGNLGMNASFSFTFAVAGTFNYVCAIHSGMNGTIIVQ